MMGTCYHGGGSGWVDSPSLSTFSLDHREVGHVRRQLSSSYDKEDCVFLTVGYFGVVEFFGGHGTQEERKCRQILGCSEYLQGMLSFHVAHTCGYHHNDTVWGHQTQVRGLHQDGGEVGGHQL